MKACDFVLLKFTLKEIEEKRKEIGYRFLLESKNIHSGIIENISNLDLKLLFQLYDDIFFNSYFTSALKENIKFSLSTKMTRSAGKTIYGRKGGKEKVEETYEIRMAAQFFFQYDDVNRAKTVCGIETKDAVEAFQIVWEHELCHLIEFYLYKESNCKGNRFKQFAGHIFGHTKVYHELPTNREVVYEKYGLKVGDIVEFYHENKMQEGIIYSIHKRATVMVLDENGVYANKKGNKYSKWYVPVAILKKRL